jgi:plastocyanin
MKKALSLLVIAAAAFALAACGGGSDNESSTPAASAPSKSPTTAGGGGAATLALAANKSALKYDKTSLSAEAGEVTIDFDNPAAIPHDVTIEDSSGKDVGKTDQISQSKTSTTVDLQPGTYTFYCSVDGHKDAGMKGTLTVK